MYNLRSLFNMRRFVGCENPRQQFGPFAKDTEPPLSLRCEETPAGGVQLVLHDGDTRLPALAYPLPERVAVSSSPRYRARPEDFPALE